MTDETTTETDEQPETELGPDPQQLRRVTEDLPCALTDKRREELLDRATRIPLELTQVDAEKRQHIATFEAAKGRHKTATTECALRREELEGELSRIGTQLRDGLEVQPVEVEERAHYDTGMVERVRTDTAETIGSRPMTDSERQMQLVPQDDEDGDSDALVAEVEETPAGETDAPDALDGVRVDERTGNFETDLESEFDDGMDV